MLVILIKVPFIYFHREDIDVTNMHEVNKFVSAQIIETHILNMLPELTLE